MKKRLLKSKSGQIWVETMVYTLIAFALIGLVLAFVKPKIEEIQDKGIIEQSINVMDDIDFFISGLGGSGNQRVIELGLSKGSLTIDSESDKLVFKIESRYEYSQPGQNINVGNIIASTEQKGKIYDVTLLRDYSGLYNITSNGADIVKEINRAATPYKITIAQKGEDSSGNIVIDIKIGTG